VMGEPLADFPPLAQEADGAVGGDAPDKVQPPDGEGERLGQGPGLRWRQAAALDAGRCACAGVKPCRAGGA